MSPRIIFVFAALLFGCTYVTNNYHQDSNDVSSAIDASSDQWLLEINVDVISEDMIDVAVVDERADAPTNDARIDVMEEGDALADAITHDAVIDAGDEHDAAVLDVATHDTAADVLEESDSTPVDVSTVLVALAASPTSSVVVSHSTNVSSVGIVLSADPVSTAHVTQLCFTGVGNVDGTFRAERFSNVITTCSLFDGSAQIGLAQTPNPLTGRLCIARMDVIIPAGTSHEYVLRCTTGSVIVQPGGDRYAVGISTAADVTAVDDRGYPMRGLLAPALVANASSTPSVIVTVIDHGTLTIVPDNMRMSTIVVGGTDTWQNVAQYRATAQFESVRIERINVVSTGDAANFTQIGVAVDDAVHGWDILPAGTNQNHDVDMTTSPILVPRNSSTTIQVWAKLAHVQASSSVVGATTGVCRSGNVVRLGLNAGLTTSDEWGMTFASSLNVHAIGIVSGHQIYTNGTRMLGNGFVIRQSSPTITRYALSSTTLHVGIMDLYRLQVSADASGSIAIKKLTFMVAVDSARGSFTLSSFRLRRGSTEMAPGTYQILNADDPPISLITGGFGGTQTQTVAVVFVGEERMSGSGNVYALSAHVGGTVVSGAQIVTSLVITPSSTETIYTGMLDSTPVSRDGMRFIGPNLFLPTSSRTMNAGLIWSDVSEIPHYSGDTPGSVDWTDGAFVDDMTQTQTLSY